MKLHHYCHLEKAREILARGSLVPSCPLSFNDPFECCWEMVGNYTREHALRDVLARVGDTSLFLEIKGRIAGVNTQADYDRHLVQNAERMADDMLSHVNGWTYLSFRASNTTNVEKNLRILCFCDAERARSELLMWAHYTRGHRGVRLLLEFPSEIERATRLSPVMYREERVKMDRSWEYPCREMADAIRESLYSKSVQWVYEQEVRMVFESVEKSPFRKGDELDIPLEPSFLKGVDYGVGLTDEDRRTLEEALSKKFPGTLRRSASISPSNYELHYDQVGQAEGVSP